MIHRIAALLGWAGLASMVYATLCPIELRPDVTDAHYEHFGAFAILGLIFTVAFPRRIGLVVLIVLGSALSLELAQLLTPDRHGRVFDAVVKAAGGLCGVWVALAAHAAIKWRRTQVI